MTRRGARTAASMEIERAEDVPAQSRQMDLDPVVRPIDTLGSVGMVLGVGGRERFVERANVGAVESVDQLLDVRAIDFDQLARHRGVGAELVDALLKFFGALGVLAEKRARGAGAPLEQLGQR